MFPQIGLQAVLDDANFRKGFANYTKSVDQMIAKTGLASNSVGGQFAALGSKVLAFGGAIAVGAAAGVAGLTAATIGLGVASVQTAVSFESAFAGVLKTTDGLGDSINNLTPAGEALMQGFRDLAKEVPIAVEELAKIGELGGQLGVPKEALIDFTETVAALGVATNLTTEEAAVAFAQMANVMQTPQDQFDNMASAVVELGNNFATTERDIVNFSQRIAGAGAIAGLTEADIFGISAAFSSVGVEAEAGGTAVQKVLLAMNTSVVEGNEKLETFARTAGMSAEEFKNAWEKDAGGAFATFVQGLGMAGDDAIGILSELGLEDQRLIRGFLSVANAGDLMTRAIDTSTDAFAANTALQTEAARRYATTASQFQLLKNNVRDLGITLGLALLPALGSVFGFINSTVFPVLQDFAKYIAAVVEDGDYLNDWLSHLPTALQPVAEAIGRVVGAIYELLSGGGLTGAAKALGIPPEIIEGITAFATALSDFVQNTVIPFVTTHAESIKGAFLGIGAVLAGAGIVAAVLGIAGAIASLANPITLIIGVAALLGAAWSGNWFGIRDTVTQVVGAVMGVVGPFISSLIGWWEQNREAIFNKFITVWNLVKTVVQTAISAIRPLVQSFITNLTANLSAFQPVMAAFQKLWAALVPLFQTVVQIIGGLLVGFVGYVVGMFSGMANSIGPFVQMIGAVLTNIVNIFTGVVNVIGGLLKLLVGLFTGNGEMIKAAFGQMGQGVVQIVTNLVQGVVNLVTGLVNTVSAYVQGFVKGIIQFFYNLYMTLVGGSIIPDLVNAAINLFRLLVSTVISVIQGFVAGAVALFTGFAAAVQAIMAGLSAAWSAAWNLIASITTAAWNLIRSVVAAGIALVQAVITTGINLIRTLWSTTWTLITAVLNGKWAEIKSIVTLGINTAKSVIENGINEAKSIWDNVWGGFVGTVTGAAGSIIGKLQDLLGSVKDIVGNILSEAAKIGSNIIGGLTGGGGGGGGGRTSNTPAGAAKAQAQSYTKSWKSSMGIASPSKVMAEIGEQINRGLVVGMNQTTGFVERAVRSTVATAMEQARATARVNVAAGAGSGRPTNITNIDRRVYLTMNPNYAQIQSPADVYLDATAALNAAKL